MSNGKLFCGILGVLLAVPGNVPDADPAGTTDPVPGAEAPAGEVTLDIALEEEIDALLLTPEVYFYESLGRRDIFLSLVAETDGDGDANGVPSSGDVVVVGILWAENDRFALVETADGRSQILREGSRLGDGVVTTVLPDRIVVHVTRFGTSKNVTLPLVEGGGFDERSHRR
ncbi:MAG: hypothetical protein GF346_07640 [Candidatus Eisenbacteria bacterium]|nr:hypothetical protein [Candidatus Latescibacterota bacterium]MBD3302304.1 hypothetical protein [Candidatus Eisenbacteria bacterium]